MGNEVIYEWDENKRQENIAKRGLDIAYLAPMVFDSADVLIKADMRKDYGEPRANAYAIIKGVPVCVTFTIRGENVRLITIHKIREKIWRKLWRKK